MNYTDEGVSLEDILSILECPKSIGYCDDCKEIHFKDRLVSSNPERWVESGQDHSPETKLKS